MRRLFNTKKLDGQLPQDLLKSLLISSSALGKPQNSKSNSPDLDLSSLLNSELLLPTSKPLKELKDSTQVSFLCGADKFHTPS